MGYSTTPTFAVHFAIPGQRWTPAAWNTKRDGRPSEATLARYIEALEASTAPGGCNAHLGKVTVTSARVVRQSTGETVATYEAPAFDVVGELATMLTGKYQQARRNGATEDQAIVAVRSLWLEAVAAR